MTDENPYVMMPKIMGSCNGLVLLSTIDTDDLFLWNPSTRCCNNANKVLSYGWNDEDGFYGISRVVAGLCYDSALDNYKAVVALRDFDLPDSSVFRK